MGQRKDFLESPVSFDLNKHIVLERGHYESLLVRLRHLEQDRQEKKRGFWQWFLQRPAAILVVLMMVGVLGAADIGEQKGFYSGNAYLNSPDSLRVGYIAGVSDTIGWARGQNGNSNFIKFERCTEGMTLGQIRNIVEKLLRDQPQYRHFPMAYLAWSAIVDSCHP